MVWLFLKRHYCKVKVSNTVALFRSRRPSSKMRELTAGTTDRLTHTLFQELCGGFTSLLVRTIKATGRDDDKANADAVKMNKSNVFLQIFLFRFYFKSLNENALSSQMYTPKNPKGRIRFCVRPDRTKRVQKLMQKLTELPVWGQSSICTRTITVGSTPV